MSTNLNITVSSTTNSSDTLVVFVGSKTVKSEKKAVNAKGLTKTLLNKITSIPSEDFSGAAGQQLVYRDINLEGWKNLVVLGLGDTSKLNLETLRRAGGVVTRDLQIKSKNLAVYVDNITG